MSFDGGFCKAVTVSLGNILTGAKIEKIHSPEKDKLRISVYLPENTSIGGNEPTRRATLIVSINPTLPLLFFGEPESDNPSAPSPFCMLLRKHLTSAAITAVYQPKFDRVVCIEISKRDELGYFETKTLCFEIMGKYSNMFLLSGSVSEGNAKILGCARAADLTESKRITLNGAIYELPEQDKIDPSSVSHDIFLELVTSPDNSEKRTDSFLLQTFTGFSPLISREIAFRTAGSTDKSLNEQNHEKLWDAFESVVGDAIGGGKNPCIIYGNEGKRIAYSFTNLYQYTGFEKRDFTDVFSLQAEQYEKTKNSELTGGKKRELQKLVASRIAKTEKILSLRHSELDECRKMDEYKMMGDLITASIYMLKQGQETAELPDYENGGTIKVELDPKLTPAANAQRYYKKYRKLRHAEEKQIELIEIAEAELKYLESVEYSLMDAQNERELEDIREELAESGHSSQKKKNGFVQKTKKSEPLRFVTSGGYTIRVGKNNVQNDRLTFSADKDDLWFHVKNLPGSHVIMYTDGAEPSEADYTEAAEIAAYYSQARESAKVSVDYTKRRFLKKPAGAKPGFVTYDKYYTAVVSPKSGTNE
ncbi:MAG: NFACT family protein [Eubacteriales bacterium]|nr:NFACT family protein [Eubacteriales bacterium]MDD4474706.1 NFACT family protein [Eubacteriales bacterium]